MLHLQNIIDTKKRLIRVEITKIICALHFIIARFKSIDEKTAKLAKEIGMIVIPFL